MLETGRTSYRDGPSGYPRTLYSKKVYVASSWQNEHQPAVVQALRKAYHYVYDFKNPPDGSVFNWKTTLNPDYQHGDKVSPDDLKTMLRHPLAEAGFKSDHGAMEWADVIVYLLPCGRSASIEFGWAAGSGRKTVALVLEPVEPDLMFKEADLIATSIEEVVEFLESPASSNAHEFMEGDGPESTCWFQPQPPHGISAGEPCSLPRSAHPCPYPLHRLTGPQLDCEKR